MSTNLVSQVAGFLLQELKTAVQIKKLNFLTLEDGTDRLSRNVVTELPLYAA
jgi:hypothetical protein